MGLMDTLINESKPAPPKVLAYGLPGVGKTTLAADAKAVLIDCENGAGAIPKLHRTPYLKTWPEIKQWLDEMAALTKPPRVVAIDTLDWMVQRIKEHVVVDLDPKKPGQITNSLGASHGGYFQARDIISNFIYRYVLPPLNAMNSHGAAILLLAHAANVKITTPEGTTVFMAAPDLPEFILPAFVEWSDCVFYAKDAGERRVLQTVGSNVVVAKNRYSLPAELPLSWGSFVSAMAQKWPKPEQAASASPSANGEAKS